jgi:hypothetical protein
MSKIKRVWKSMFVLLLLLPSGCKTTYESVDAPPVWAVTPPQSDDQVWYFQSEGISSSEEDSQYAAVDVLFYNIMSAIGLSREQISTLPEPAKQFFNGLRNDIVRATLLPGAAKYPGYSALDRAVMTDTKGMVHIYYLSAFSNEGFAQLKRSVSPHFWFEDPIVTDLESKARDKVDKGEVYSGILLYMEAAFLGLESGGSIADILFNRNMGKAEELLSRLVLEKGLTPLSVMGSDYAQPFTAIARDSETGSGQGGIPLVAIFPEQDRNGLMKMRSARVVTGKDGRMLFFPPAPNFYGKATITVGISDDFLPEDRAFPSYVTSSIDRVRSILKTKYLIYDYDISFDPRKIPTGLLVLDTDIVKKPLKETVTEKTIELAMLEAGYAISVMDLGPEVLLKKKDSELIRDLRTVYSDKYERIVYGICSVTGFKNENGLYVAEVTANLSVLDVKRGTVTITRSIIKTASAKDSQQALSSAFMLAGKAFAQFYLTQP